MLTFIFFFGLRLNILLQSLNNFKDHIIHRDNMSSSVCSSKIEGSNKKDTPLFSANLYIDICDRTLR